ncbi:hypothetical protein J4558_24385 [Leptolyngbya sp. 15MV]|nr:hypothetical protein J4558_24385 [Leptolyngbya sp. 15MV]
MNSLRNGIHPAASARDAVQDAADVAELHMAGGGARGFAGLPRDEGLRHGVVTLGGGAGAIGVVDVDGAVGRHERGELGGQRAAGGLGHMHEQPQRCRRPRREPFLEAAVEERAGGGHAR